MSGVNLQDRAQCPALEEIEAYIHNPLFSELVRHIKETYQCKEKMEFSSCSWEKGWNIKFRKAGKTLCTIYPRENFFTVLIVIGQNEKERTESLLPDCTKTMQEIYQQTKEGNGQRWLMIDLEDHDALYDDVLRLIEIRQK